MRRRTAKARLRLGRQRRLRGTGAFEALLRQGRRSARQGFVFYTVRREAGPPRLGILVSRRHAAKATVRNRIRRFIREAFRLEQAALGSLDVLVRPPRDVRPGPQALARLRALLSELAG